jgi:hypothetical protein
MNIVNLTPHALRITTEEGRTVEVPTSGTIARVKIARWAVRDVVIDAVRVPICTAVKGEVYDLPPSREGTLFVVSRLVADSAPDRTDLVVPDDMLRDEAGRTSGFRVFSATASPEAPTAFVARAREESEKLFALCSRDDRERLERATLKVLDDAARSAAELEACALDTLLAREARAAGLDGAASARATLAEHSGFEEVRRMYGADVLLQPAFVCWVTAAGEGAASVFAEVVAGRARVVVRNLRFRVEAIASR